MFKMNRKKFTACLMKKHPFTAIYGRSLVTPEHYAELWGIVYAFNGPDEQVMGLKGEPVARTISQIAELIEKKGISFGEDPYDVACFLIETSQEQPFWNQWKFMPKKTYDGKEGFALTETCKEFCNQLNKELPALND